MGFLASKAGTKRVSTSVQKAKRVWEAVLGDLEVQVPRPSYETWLKGTVGVDYGDGELVVGTPNTFVAEMLERRMYSLISQSLARVVAGGAEVRFRLVSDESSGSEHSNGDGSARAMAKHVDSGSVAIDQAPKRQADNPGPGSRRGNRLNSRYTFGTFIVGRSNELAHAASEAVSGGPGHIYNPLFIYSNVGLGKTHLLHAIGHHVMRTGLSLIYATTEEFTNEYIKAIREGKTEEFRALYRSADVLLLDDIQFIIGKEQTQEGFFHTFNALHMAARQIVITSDRPVTDLTLLEDRVRSRLEGGLVVDIQTPDLETRAAILRAKADETGIRFPPEVLQFLSERIHNNIRELEGTLNRIAAYAQLRRSAITLDLVKRSLADALSPPRTRRVSEQMVLDAVSAYFSVDEETLKGRRRDKHTALARQVTMYLLREEANLTLKSIGKVLGGKDHTTALHACLRIAEQLNDDAHLRRDILNIRESLGKD